MSDQPTISELATRVDKPAWWVRRRIHERERETGARILVYIGEGRHRPTYRVDLNELRRVAPEFFSRDTEIAKALAIWRRSIEREIAQLREMIEDSTEQTTVLTEAVRKVSRSVEALGGRS